MRKQLINMAMFLLAAALSMPAFAQTPAGRSDYWHHGWGWGHIIFSSVMMVVFWGGIVLAIVLAGRWLRGDPERRVGSQPRTKAPFDILH